MGSATALIWKLLTVAEKRFRKLNALDATPCCAGNIGLARCSVWGGNSGGRLPKPFGDFDFGSDALALFEASVDNIFVLKSNYWLNL